MGYLCTVFAANAERAMLDKLREVGTHTESSNIWNYKDRRYFFKRGRENRDGSITGVVCRLVHYTSNTASNDFEYGKRVGSVRIEPDGVVTRWPTSSIKQRAFASVFAKEMMKNYTDTEKTI